MVKSDVIDLEARLIHETKLARLFDFGLDEDVWLPKSVHEWDPSDNMVTMPQRMAEQKGLI